MRIVILSFIYTMQQVIPDVCTKVKILGISCENLTEK